MIKFLSFITILVLFFSGCATTDLQTSVKMTKSVWLQPAKTKGKSIYVSIKNTSQEHIEIEPLLIQQLQSKGFKIVNDAKVADYVLMVNILFANSLREANAVKTGTGLGVASGVIASTSSNSNMKDSLLIGAGVALASGLVAHSLEDETYKAVVDLVVNEKLSGASGKSLMGSGYKEHKTRILAEAVRVDLKLDEALPILSEKIAKQIADIF